MPKNGRFTDSPVHCSTGVILVAPPAHVHGTVFYSCKGVMYTYQNNECNYPTRSPAARLFYECHGLIYSYRYSACSYPIENGVSPSVVVGIPVPVLWTRPNWAATTSTSTTTTTLAPPVSPVSVTLVVNPALMYYSCKGYLYNYPFADCSYG